VLDNLWLGQEEGEAIAAALGPKLQKTKGAVEQLLFEVATLEVRGLEGGGACALVSVLSVDCKGREDRPPLSGLQLTFQCKDYCHIPALVVQKHDIPDLLLPALLSHPSLQVSLEGRADAVTLANLMPKHWADFIRNSPMEEVKPMGTTPLRI
jgi:hypothetical protein